jgi:hypothetical protein
LHAVALLRVQAPHALRQAGHASADATADATVKLFMSCFEVTATDSVHSLCCCCRCCCCCVYGVIMLHGLLLHACPQCALQKSNFLVVGSGCCRPVHVLEQLYQLLDTLLQVSVQAYTCCCLCGCLALV